MTVELVRLHATKLHLRREREKDNVEREKGQRTMKHWSERIQHSISYTVAPDILQCMRGAYRGVLLGQPSQTLVQQLTLYYHLQDEGTESMCGGTSE